MKNSAYIKSNVRKASIPRLSRSVLERLIIPVPPLPIQREIVKILDNFTELTARQKQYDYYRDIVFDSIDCKKMCIREFADTNIGLATSVTKHKKEHGVILLHKSGEYKGDTKDFSFNYSEAPSGTVAIWPVTRKGSPCVWRLIPSRLVSDWKKGYIKIAPQNPGKTQNIFTIQYLSDGIIKKIKSGELEAHRASEDERIPTLEVENYKTAGATIQTIWTDKAFYTTNGGNKIADILGSKKAFSYPKPLAIVFEIIQRTTSHDFTILRDLSYIGFRADYIYPELEYTAQEIKRRFE